MTEVEMTVQAAHNDCAVANITTMPPYNQVVANRFHSILSARRCWSNLCSTQIHLKLESSWIKSCADIELPFPTLPTEGMFSMAADRVYRDSVLTCMLDYAMDLPPLVFGLDAATSSDGETCFPPGYSEDDPRICRDTIAPYVLSNCTQLVEKDEEFPMDRFMSFTYGDGGGGGNNGYDFVGEFCNLLLDLGSVENRACLLDLCNSTGTENPSASPTFVPSFTPSQSVRPSATALPSGEPSASVPPSRTTVPSQLPSLWPTAKPSNPPSIAPSWVPSRIPTIDPSVVPSRTPTGLPSFLPSWLPSSLPTGVPSFVPSRKPSASPSSMPSVSTSPSITDTPSLIPTVSLEPSISAPPSEQPSIYPTTPLSWVPSASPTNLPSSFPSVPSLQGLVRVDLFSILTLNISFADVPGNQGELNRFVDVLEGSISEMVPGNDTTTVHSLSAMPVGRRRSLQPSNNLNVDFEVNIQARCYHINCTAFAIHLLRQAEGSLDMSVDDDSLSDKINARAIQQNVSLLTSASVLDLEHVHNSTRVTDPMPEEPGDGDSSASHYVKYGSTVLAMAVMLWIMSI